MKINNKVIVISICVLIVILVIVGVLVFKKDETITKNDPYSEYDKNYTDGTYSDTMNYDDVVVTGKNVTLENVTVNKLVIAKEVGNGTVYLNNVNVKEELQVLGGGKNSVYINNSKVEGLISDYDDVRIVINEKTTIQKVEVKKVHSIEVSGKVSEIKVEKENTKILTKKDAVIEKLTTNKKVVVEGTGTIKVIVTTKRDNIKTADTIKVDEMIFTEDKEYIVTFDTTGGNSIESIKVLENHKVVIPTNPVRVGYNFLGWFVGNQNYDFNNEVTSNITLIAKWEKIVVNQDKYYTVTFVLGNGANNIVKSVKENTIVSNITNPTRAGYNFKGFTLNGNIYNFNNKVTSNITLTAKWEKIDVYTITTSLIDPYSPDIKLVVKKNGSTINVSSVSKENGTVLCLGSNLVVSKIELQGLTSLKVKLTNGTIVNASLN